MSYQVNFTAHGHALKTAYDAILRAADPKTADNWALFGYDKATNDLKVLGQGSGGLEELEEEFLDHKVQYAFVRVVDPNSQLNKFILIAWCGEAVPDNKKALFSSHLADVSQFLKGYHLQIHARNEADVTPAQIMKRVNESSGSKYSIHNETRQAEKITPLQSAYKKTEIPDIASMQRNPTKPVPAPTYGLGSRSTGSSTPAAPTTSNNVATERSWKTSTTSSYSSSTGASSFNKVAPPSSLSNFDRPAASSTVPNEPSMNKAQQIRLEREAREKEERERIKREIEASEARQRQAQGQSSAQREAEERRLQEEREREQQQKQQEEERRRGEERAREERAAREREERERAEAEDAAQSARAAAKVQEDSVARERERAAEEERLQRVLQEQQREQEEEAAQRRRQEEEEKETRRLQEEAEEEERRLQAEADAAAFAQTVDHADAPAHAAASGSVSALVLYAYDKAEENEMSLVEGEVIYNVAELDVGWWTGESADGTRSGLFPANYVEVIEQEEAAPAAEHEEVHHASAATEHATTDEVLSVKPTAVALYDYNAGEPNEISFSEGDLIKDIE
ncbi:hypothetical protein BGZ99_007136, partial [Dissophora globulifera]